MTKLKLLAAAAVLSTVVVAPAMAQQVYYRGHDGYRDRGPVDAAAGIAGFAVGTAAAIATAPFRDSYAYDNGYGYDNGYATRNGFVCQPGTWFVAKTVADTSVSKPYRNKKGGSKGPPSTSIVTDLLPCSGCLKANQRTPAQ